MKIQVLQEIKKQKELIGYLTEGVYKKFTDAISTIVRIGTNNMTDPSVFRNLFDELPIRAELNSKNINSLDDLFEDVRRPFTKGGQPNPEKILDEAIAQRIFTDIEKTMFGNKKWDPLADLIISQIFTTRNISPQNIQFFNQLLQYAVKGDATNFYKLKGKLKQYFDDFFLTFAERKLVKKDIEEFTDEASWWEKILKPAIDLGTGVATLLKNSYGIAKAKSAAELEQKMARMITLMKSIEAKSTTIGSSIDIDKEVSELNRIASEIGQIKKHRLEVLWSQWKDEVPEVVKRKINQTNVADDPIYLKYVRYFESITKNDAIVEKPTYMISRLNAFFRTFSLKNPEKLPLRARFHRLAERSLNGFLLGDFRTYREMGRIYESLDNSVMQTVGYMGMERVLAHTVYYPMLWAFYKTIMGYYEKEGGYEMEPIIQNGKQVGFKYKLDSSGKKIPKRDMWWAEGDKFLGDAEDAKYFGSVFLDYAGEELFKPWKELHDGQFWKSFTKFVVPGGERIFESFMEMKNVRSDQQKIQWDKERQRLEEQRIQAERAQQDSIRRARTIDSLNTVAKEKLDQLQRKADSATGKGVFEKIQQVIDTNDINF